MRPKVVIRNAEIDIANKVDYDDIREYVTAVTGTLRYLNVPDDCLVVRSVQIINSSTRDFLEKRDTSFIYPYFMLFSIYMIMFLRSKKYESSILKMNSQCKSSSSSRNISLNLSNALLSVCTAAFIESS